MGKAILSYLIWYVIFFTTVTICTGDLYWSLGGHWVQGVIFVFITVLINELKPWLKQKQ